MSPSRLALIATALVFAASACSDASSAAENVVVATTGATTTAAPNDPTPRAPSSTITTPPTSTPTTTTPTTTTSTTTTSTTTTMPIPDPIKPIGERQMIEVSNPMVGAVATSPLTIRGNSNTADGLLFYRLSAGGSVLARGYTAGGFGDWQPFEVTITFENPCCVEMLLELYEVAGMGEAEINVVAIPLTYPETS